MQEGGELCGACQRGRSHGNCSTARSLTEHVSSPFINRPISLAAPMGIYLVQNGRKYWFADRLDCVDLVP